MSNDIEAAKKAIEALEKAPKSWEENFVLAKFMGLKARIITYPNGVTHQEIDKDFGIHKNWVDIKYHESWDALMPVYSKLEKLMLEIYLENAPTFGGPHNEEFIERFMLDEEDLGEEILSGDIGRAHKAIHKYVVKYGKP